MFARRSLVVIVMCPGIECERERGLCCNLLTVNTPGRDNNYKGHFNNMPGVIVCVRCSNIVRSLAYTHVGEGERESSQHLFRHHQRAHQTGKFDWLNMYGAAVSSWCRRSFVCLPHSARVGKLWCFVIKAAAKCNPLTLPLIQFGSFKTWSSFDSSTFASD